MIAFSFASQIAAPPFLPDSTTAKPSAAAATAAERVATQESQEEDAEMEVGDFQQERPSFVAPCSWKVHFVFFVWGAFSYFVPVGCGDYISLAACVCFAPAAAQISRLFSTVTKRFMLFLIQM